MKGHRNVVSSYGGPLRELQETKTERVKIAEGVSLGTFKEVLQYLYTDECTIGNDNVFELLHAAKIFQLQDLMDRCVIILTSYLTIENVVAHTEQALHFDVKEYLRICKDYFRINTREVLNTKEFLEGSNEVLLEFVSTNGIGCSELELFMACLEWAENDCRRKNLEPNAVNSRLCLGDVLSQIKFSNLSKDDFMSIVVPTDILTNEEVVNIIKDWQKKKDDQMPERLDAKAAKEKIQQTTAKMGANAHTQGQADHPGLNVNQVVQVTVETCTFSLGWCVKESVALTFPLSSRISQVKEMKIFEEGRRQCPSDKFTLEHKGKELADDTTLASIYSPGEDFILKLHSFTFTLKDENGAWEFPLTFTFEEYKSRFVEIFKEHVQRLKGIMKVPIPWAYPGETIYMHLW